MATATRSRRRVTPNDNISAALADLVPDELQGTDRFVDIVNWNIRFFNVRDTQRVELIAKIMSEINGDIFVCEEIEEGALDPVAERLTSLGAGLYKTAYGTTGGDQRVALMYDMEWVKASQTPDELFRNEDRTAGNGKDAFPRLPLHSRMVARDVDRRARPFDFHLVGVHLKSQRASGGDNGAAQRETSAQRLAKWVTKELDDETDAIILGDWNAPVDRKEWESIRKLEKKGKVGFVAFNPKDEPSHFFKSGQGSRLDLVLVTDDAIAKARATGRNGDKDIARVIPWNGAFEDKAFLAELIERISDHFPVISRFYFTDKK